MNQIDETRRALIDLHAAGHRTCVFLRWDAKTWSRVRESERLLSLGGFRLADFKSGGALTRERGQLPIDLRLAYARCRALAETYGDLVDAWEADNEPDLAFVPENGEHYAAFLKACWLGFKAGGAKTVQSPASRLLHERTPLVVMAPMGLPPGTWFERFVANDGLSYTDAFNFHYYGYAEDFTGVYRVFEDAVAESSQRSAFSAQQRASGSKQLAPSSKHQAPSNQQLAPDSQLSSLSSQLKQLPVFATEIGYGMLGMRERDTKVARLRQWRWFKSVGEQAVELGMEAPMGFYLQRYHEATGIEFGLTVPHTSPKHFNLYTRDGWFSGNNYYTPTDFGATDERPWMKRIGRRMAGGDVTPALAWWLGRDSSTQPKREWKVAVAAPSPIVIDLIAHENVYGEHRYNAYFVRGTGPEASGPIDVVLYNFSDRPVKGSLRLPAFLQGASTNGIELAPLERRVIPTTVKVSAQRFIAREARIEFVSSDVPTARFVTQFYPQFEGRSVAQEWRLTEAQVTGSPSSFFEATRDLATEEAPKHRENSCWVQQGAAVKWTDEGFVVTITGRPPNKERRVEVEIPWPADWDFTSDRLLKTSYRAVKLAPRGKGWPAHDEFMLQVRTANGNLYAAPPIRALREEWDAFWEPAPNFTLWFYGRANLPWEFTRNRPVSLVLVFYPVDLPAVYEFRRPGLVSLAARN